MIISYSILVFKSTQARCVSHLLIYVTCGLIPQIGNASVARDAAQTELGEHRRPFAEGSGHRLGSMHDGCERQFDVRLDDHFLPTCSPVRQPGAGVASSSFR